MIKVKGCVIILSCRVATASIVQRVIQECFVRCHIFVNRGRPCDQNVLCDQILPRPSWRLSWDGSGCEKDVSRLNSTQPSLLTLAIKKETELC